MAGLQSCLSTIFLLGFEGGSGVGSSNNCFPGTHGVSLTLSVLISPSLCYIYEGLGAKFPFPAKSEKSLWAHGGAAQHSDVF